MGYSKYDIEADFTEKDWEEIEHRCRADEEAEYQTRKLSEYRNL